MNFRLVSDPIREKLKVASMDLFKYGEALSVFSIDLSID